MNKFNVGDKVRIKEDLSKCEFGYTPYMDAYKGKNAIVVKVWSGGGIELDIDKRFWNWSENVLELIEENDNMNMKIEEGKTMKMKRIDYILNAKDNIQTILDETILDCNICPSSCEDCNGNCEFYYKKYLNEEIEVDKSKLKLVEENIEVENDAINPFIEEYEKIVNETMELCKRKNADYGNATDESFKQFGDVSYQVRCFDKWSRINTLLKNGKAEVSESLEDSLLDLANYLFLWVTSRRLNEK